MRPQRVVLAMSVCTALLCGLEWCAWHFHVPFLTRLLSEAPRIVPATALMLVGDAIALALTNRPTRWAGIALAGIVALANFAVIVAHLFEPSRPGQFVRGTMLASGVPSPDTAVAACCVALSTAFVSVRRRRWAKAAHLLAVLAIAMGMFVVVAHLFGARALYRVEHEVGMSPMAAAAVVLLGFGALSVTPRYSVARILYLPGEGGRLARRFLPFVFGTPLLLAALMAFGLRRHWYTDEAGIAVLVVCLIAALGVVTWRYALNVNASEARLERLVALRTERLRETVNDVEEFSQALAHDVRGPLINLRQFLELLRVDHAGEMSDEAQDLVERAVRSGRRIDLLTRAMLRYGEISRRPFQLQTVEVRTAVEAAIQTVPSRTDDFRAQIDVEEPLAAVWADQSALQVVFQELLDNACRFTRPGEPPQVTISGVSGPAHFRIYVRDRGVGIDPRFQQQIFHPFEQLVRAPDHAGIGLALVRRALAKMSGRVGVVSDGQHGSIFWVDLPQTSRAVKSEN